MPIGSSVEDLVARFENGSLPASEWTHAAHLAVASWYCSQLAFPDALDAVRQGVLRHNARHGVVTTRDRGYHETVTVLFERLVAARLASPAAPSVWPDRFWFVERALGRKEIVHRYYSRSRIESWEARVGWLEPDLLPLPAAASLRDYTDTVHATGARGSGT